MAFRNRLQRCFHCRNFPLAVVVIFAFFLILFISFGRCILAAESEGSSPVLTRQEADQRFQQMSDVNYALELHISADNTRYTGVTTIHFAMKDVPTDLRLDFRGRTHLVTVNGKALRPKMTPSYVVVPGAALVRGPNTIVVEFDQDYSEDGQGFNRFQDPRDQRVYLYTDLAPYMANRVFPCFDQPDLKASEVGPGFGTSGLGGARAVPSC